MSLLQWISRAVCTERKHQPSCFALRWVYYSDPTELFALKESASRAVLHWDEFTTVNQPSCLHWEKAPAELFALRWVYSTTVPFKYIACYLFATEHNCVHTHFESANLRYHIMFIIVCVHIYGVCMRRKWLILHIKPQPFCVKSVWEKVCILRIQFYTISLF